MQKVYRIMGYSKFQGLYEIGVYDKDKQPIGEPFEGFISYESALDALNNMSSFTPKINRFLGKKNIPVKGSEVNFTIMEFYFHE